VEQRRLAFTECQRLVHEALAADPLNVRALETLGALRRANGKPREALAAYETAAADRNDTNAHAQIGRLKLDLGEPRGSTVAHRIRASAQPTGSQRALWFTFAGLAHLYAGEPGVSGKIRRVTPQFVTALIFLAAAQERYVD
jgi:hypothetical protein